MMVELVKRTYECDGKPQKSYQEEAYYYLEDNNYDFEAAVKCFADDYKYEKNNAQRFK